MGSTAAIQAGLRGRAGRWLRVIAVWFMASALLGAAETAPTSHTLVCFGDSLTAGYGLDDPAHDAYPAVLQRKMEAAKLPWKVVNAGVSGETTAGGLRRIDWILRQRVDLFLLALGGNDGLRGIDPDLTRRNLEQIIQRVRSRYPTARIVIAGMQMPPGMGEDYTRRFRDVFPSVARDEHVVLLPFLLDGVAGHADLNQADGIHPTAAGDLIVAENVWKIIHPLL